MDIEKFISKEDSNFKIPAWEIMYRSGDLALALLYSDLFYPNLVEIAGSVLLNDGTDDLENRFLLARSSSFRALEKLEESFNLVEISYLFEINSFNSNDSEQQLAEIMARSWLTHLQTSYFERKFSVRVLSPQESGSVYSISFHEVRAL